MARRNRPNGYTLAEAAMGLSVAALLLSASIKPAAAYISHTRVNRAVAVVAADLDRARSTASRQQMPVRVAFDTAAMRYTITTRAGAVMLSRSIGAGTDLSLTGASFAPATVDLFPGGVASGGLTVTLSVRAYARSVTMTRVGFIRIL